jgi:hypothetical protein
MMNFYEILEELEEARKDIGYEFIRKETVFECATKIYVKQMENLPIGVTPERRKDNDKR